MPFGSADLKPCLRSAEAVSLFSLNGAKHAMNLISSGVAPVLPVPTWRARSKSEIAGRRLEGRGACMVAWLVGYHYLRRYSTRPRVRAFTHTPHTHNTHTHTRVCACIYTHVHTRACIYPLTLSPLDVILAEFFLMSASDMLFGTAAPPGPRFVMRLSLGGGLSCE